MDRHEKWAPPARMLEHERASADAKDKLAKLLGDECAASVMTAIAMVGLIKTFGNRPEIEGLLLKSRPRAQVRDDMQRVAAVSAELADLLYPHDTAAMLHMEKAARIRSPGDAVGGGANVRLAERWLSDLAYDLRRLSELAAVASERIAVKRGESPDPLRLGLLRHLAQCLAMYGLPLTTADTSKFVTVARIAWERVEFTGDPRDTLRRAVKAGQLDLKAMAREAKEVYGGMTPQEVFARDPMVRELASRIGFADDGGAREGVIPGGAVKRAPGRETPDEG